MNKWKSLPSSHISRRFMPYIPCHRSWPHVASRRTLDIVFTARASHPAMGNMLTQGKKNPKRIFLKILVYFIESNETSK